MKIAIWYHCRLSGGCSQSGATVDPVFGRKLYLEQMQNLHDSGLRDAADKIFIGMNGVSTKGIYSHGKTEILQHGAKAESLLPTMRALQQWLPGHEDYAVCFFHSKGATQPHNPLYHAWRMCMEKTVVRDWRKCVAHLEVGYDTVGCHWISREKYGAIVNPEHGGTPFWGGVYWWATAKFLLKLPPLIAEIEKKEDWFWPEHFIGSGPNPKVKDYHDAWPGMDCARTP